MKVKKLLPNAKLPIKKNPGDAGFDLSTPMAVQLKPGEHKQVQLGIAIEIDNDEVALVQGRSGLAISHGITTIGNVIDSGYRGQISAILVNYGQKSVLFNPGDRIAQLVILKLGNQIIESTESLSEAIRGDKGYGSSGLS